MPGSPETPIALHTRHLPVGLRHEPGVVWCQTTAELVVLAQDGLLCAAVLEATAPGVDGDLVHLLRRRGPVVMIDQRAARPSWEALGTWVLDEVPPTIGPLLACIHAASAPGPTGRFGPPMAGLAPVVAVIDAQGGDGAGAAVALSRALAATSGHLQPVVLADFSLDAPHRVLHGIGARAVGLPELLGHARFADPAPEVTDAALHPTPGGYLVLPGLRRHHDWVALGQRSVDAAIEAIRSRGGIVVASIDHDLEGEPETGSFDVEDRNVLARSVARSAALVVVSVAPTTTGRWAAGRRLDELGAFGIPIERIVVVPEGRKAWPLGWGRGIDRRLAGVVRSRIQAGGAPSPGPAEPGPERIVPGLLGHWAHDIDGWMTPRVPQQP